MEPSHPLHSTSKYEDRVPLLSLMTEYVAISYKHCEPQQQHAHQQQQQHLQPSPVVATAHNIDAQDADVASPSQRRILTKNATAAGNDGYDNDDRNLIVRVHDVLGSDAAVTTAPTTDAATAHYIVLDLLGQGTFGQVFRCQHSRTNQLVALKVIRNHPSYYKQALVEVEITQMLNQTFDAMQAPHIVRLLDSFEYRHHLCLVLELLSMNVYELITHHNFTGFPIDVTRSFLSQLLHALVQLEDVGVIHCDLKPENILLATGSVSTALPQLKVVDFGSACRTQATVFSYIQSRFYRSPEVLLGMPYSHAIDMWSLGCIAFELLVGLPLFPGVSEHDQLRLIEATLGPFPQSLLRTGRNVCKFYDVVQTLLPIGRSRLENTTTTTFVLKTAEQFAHETQRDVQQAKQYFKYSTLRDLVFAFPLRATNEEERLEEIERRHAFLDFVGGLLAVDPTVRWTAREALEHPFITGERFLYDTVAAATALSNEHLMVDYGGETTPPSDVETLMYDQQQQSQCYSRQYEAAHPSIASLQLDARVRPIDPLYADANNSNSSAYYSERSCTYDASSSWLPTPNYVPVAPAIVERNSNREGDCGGPGGYVYEPVAPSRMYAQLPTRQEHAPVCWPAPSLETSEERMQQFVDAFPVTQSRRTHKVAPAPPSTHQSVVLPMHQSLQRQGSYSLLSDSYDPSFLLPIRQQHQQQRSNVVAPVRSQSFETLPSCQQQLQRQQVQSNYSINSNIQHDAEAQYKAATAAGKSTRRRRRPSQSKAPHAALPLPDLGCGSSGGGYSCGITYAATAPFPPAWATASSDNSARPANVPLTSFLYDPQQHHHQQQQHEHPSNTSKRRNEHTSDDDTATAQRVWKSPRGSNTTAAGGNSSSSNDQRLYDNVRPTDDETLLWMPPFLPATTTANTIEQHNDELHYVAPYFVAPRAPSSLPT